MSSIERLDARRVDLAAIDLRDAVDLAILIEEEARRRYLELATRVGGGRYEGDAAEVFAAMASLEERQERKLLERRADVFGDAASRIDPAALCDVEAPDPSSIRPFMGPRAALQVAFEAEARGAEFYGEAAQVARDPAARVFLEEQHGEDADHCRALEAWMRLTPPGPDVEEDEADPPGSDGA